MNAKLRAEADFPTKHGIFRIYGFEAEDKSDSVVALALGDIQGAESVLARIHSQCLTGDVFGSARCDCGEQLDTALDRIAEAGSGVLLYQLQEGRGIGLMNKLLAYQLQDEGQDTVEANQRLGFRPDQRNYALCAAILHRFGVRSVKLMSNNPSKLEALIASGIPVVERVPIEIPPSAVSQHYLRTKKAKLGHLLEMV